MELGAIDVIRTIRESSPRLPIFVLSAATSVDKKVEAFDAGADDYITKPFGMRELMARLRSALRRYRFTETNRGILAVGAIKLDPLRYLVYKNGRRVHLTPREFNLLHQLMLHAGDTVTHAQLLKTIWGPQFIFKAEYLRTFVRSLRLKIEDEPCNPQYLVTEPQFGYRFVEPRVTIGSATGLGDSPALSIALTPSRNQLPAVSRIDVAVSEPTGAHSMNGFVAHDGDETEAGSASEDCGN
jgi:two-component system, OmpR family, KDP operon response regulator KdpE